MRSVFLLITALICLSCGKNGVGTNDSPSLQEICDLDGNSSSCETIQGVDGSGIDLLESMIDVKVRISDSEILFLEDKKSISTGEKIVCETSVRTGENYQFNLRGNRLWIKTLNGSYQLARLNDGEGLNGTWIWKGLLSQGTQIFRSFTFVGTNQVIMRTSCEL